VFPEVWSVVDSVALNFTANLTAPRTTFGVDSSGAMLSLVAEGSEVARDWTDVEPDIGMDGGTGGSLGHRFGWGRPLLGWRIMGVFRGARAAMQDFLVAIRDL